MVRHASRSASSHRRMSVAGGTSGPPVALTAGAALAISVSLSVVSRWWNNRRALAEVAPQFRHPALLLLTGSPSVRTLVRMRPVFRLKLPVGPRVEVSDRCITADPRVHVKIFTATPAVGRDRPAVLFIHGGGMIVGSPQFEAPVAATLARELGAVVVSPNYRLAPEHPFPAALDDCMATLRWMRDHADQLGIDGNRIAVVGGSAGGGLAAAVAQRSLDEHIRLRAQALIYPMIDDRTAQYSQLGRRGHFTWTPKTNQAAWTAYLGHTPAVNRDPPNYAAPARRNDLSGLPPAWIGVGELDTFHDEDVRYATNLEKAGVPCELVVVPGMYHGADGLRAEAPAAQAFRSSMIEQLRRHL